MYAGGVRTTYTDALYRVKEQFLGADTSELRSIRIQCITYACSPYGVYHNTILGSSYILNG
jgi:hypothetical protein